MTNPVDRLSVKTVLLGLVNDLPDQPSVNTPSQYTEAEESQHGRALAFKHELSVTDQLAFISAYSSDPLHVLATCVEEDVSKGCLIIRFAANTGQHQVLRDGLMAVSQILQNEAIDVGRSTNHEALFETVVELNHTRILSRLRSQHATSVRARNKPPLLQKLGTAKKLLRKFSVRSARTQSLSRDIDSLQRQFDRLEGMSSSEERSSRSKKRLSSLVRAIHSLHLQYEQDLKNVPITPGEWDRKATDSLIDRLEKVSQYVTACEELLRAARKYTIFSNVAVEFINLQQIGDRLSRNAASNIDRTIEASCKKKILSRVSSSCGESVSSTRGRIRGQLRRSSRLHAEIQLVLFYEQYPIPLRPRVICSSKSACYLCHLLLKIHGKYHIHSTHGRLYDAWKWPAPTQLQGGVIADLQYLLPEFTAAIDRKLRDCLNNTTVERRNVPLESRVDLFAAITPSILSHVSQHSRSVHSVTKLFHRSPELGGNVDTTHANDDDVDRISSSMRTKNVREVPALSRTSSPLVDSRMASVTTNDKDLISRNGNATPTMRNRVLEDNPMPLLRDSNALHPSSHEIIDQEYYEPQIRSLRLQKGKVASYAFDTKNPSLQVHVPGLRLDLQYDIPSPTQGNNSHTQETSFQIEVEYLSSSSIRSDGEQAVDLEELSCIEEKSTPEGILFSAEGLLLKQRSMLLRLRAGSA